MPSDIKLLDVSQFNNRYSLWLLPDGMLEWRLGNDVDTDFYLDETNIGALIYAIKSYYKKSEISDLLQ